MPVRPIVRLRVAVVWVGVLWSAGVMVGVWLELLSWRPVDALLDSPVSLIVGLGLLATAAGGVIAALASAIPGRESASRHARAAATLGAAVTLGAGLGALTAAASAPPAGLLAGSAGCLARGFGIGLLPVLAACLYVGRGFAPHPRVSLAWGAAGAVGLGSFAVHASCAMTGAHHVFLGHCLGPLFAGALLAVPLAGFAARIRHMREANS
jgi:hypothetical protein